MKRREFITLLGGAALAPHAVCAQQAMPVIGFFNTGRAATQTKNLAALRDGLKEAGFVEGRNVVIDFTWGENQFDKLPALAAEQVARSPRSSSVIPLLRSPPGTQPRPFRLFSRPAATPCGTAWFQRSTGPAAMSQEWYSFPEFWAESAWSCCASSSRRPRASALWPI